MSDTLERLRRLQGLRSQKKRTEPETSQRPPDTDLDTTSDPPHELLDGELIENAAGCCHLVTESFALDQYRGSQPLGQLLVHEPGTFSGHHPQFGLSPRLDFTQAAFIDTETTGLGGGAGIYAFMVGVGTFEPNQTSDLSFVVRQYFMRSPAEEGALLAALTDLLSRYAMTVTFNGRTFDLPLLRARVRYNSWAPDLDYDGAALLEPNRPHLDLLHPARRLWRRRLGSCRLINLEQQILAVHRSSEDVEGHLIPRMYIDYMRTRNAADINRIFYHNREDIVSMVALAARLCRILSSGPDDFAAEEVTGEDWTSLGELYLAQQELEKAEGAYSRALETLSDRSSLADAFLRLGRLQKRAGRWNDAVATWQRWISTVPGADPTPYVELAKYCEWQARDNEQAAMWTGWALHNLRGEEAERDTLSSHGSNSTTHRNTLIAELEHRLARVERKRGAAESGT